MRHHSIQLQWKPVKQIRLHNEQAKKLSQTDIKSKAYTEIVRMIALGRPVTMDCCTNRIAIVIDPQTNISVTMLVAKLVHLSTLQFSLNDFLGWSVIF